MFTFAPELRTNYFNPPERAQNLKVMKTSSNNPESNTREITTMQDLANYINGKDEWPADVEDIIEENGWVSDTGEIYGICHNDDERLIFDGDGETAIIVANGEFTYDVMFNDDTKSDTMGFHSSLQECINFIDLYNGNPNVPYFGDYKGGIVQIINNESKEVVFSADVI